MKFRHFNTRNKFSIFCKKLTKIALKNTRRLECYKQKVDEFFRIIAKINLKIKITIIFKIILLVEKNRQTRKLQFNTMKV